jgi:predicted peroxiredoxin
MGIAALSSALGAQAFANIDKKGRHALVITRGGSPPNRAAFGLLTGQTVADREWGKVYVWIILDGADLVNKNKTQGTKSSIYKIRSLEMLANHEQGER